MFKNIKLMPAPMASLTDLPLREIYIKFGAKAVITEMISSEALHYGKPSDLLIKSLSQHDYSDANFVLGAQIFGSDEKKMADAACFISQFPIDFIDINAGCPVKKVIRQHAGAYLIKDYEKFFSVCKAVTDSTKLPVTVKMRIGFNSIATNITEICEKLENIGIAALFVHARTRDEWFSGGCHWDIVGNIKSTVKIPVFANGSIDSKEYSDIDRSFVSEVMIEHLRKAESIYQEYAAVKLRKQLMLYSRRFPNSKRFKISICNSSTIKETLEAIKRWKNAA